LGYFGSLRAFRDRTPNHNGNPVLFDLVMIDLLTITNSPALAAASDALPGMRLFVDLERNGKAERQAGRNTFISTHQISDVERVKAVLRHSKLMVRVNPYDASQAAAAKREVDEVIAQGADMVMLPMFNSAAQLRAFAAIVAGRVPLVPLLETAGALACLDDWITTPGILEVFVGLNDLHLSLGCRFMFEPLVLGHVDRVAAAARRHGLRFGFGGIARVGEGLLPGQDVLAEHLRLGSQAVILSRTFNRVDEATSFEQAVAELRQAERALALRTADVMDADRLRVAGLIGQLAELAGQARQSA
jgi:2-keto-3-deoxy-L-rhamnonate aldolase RhmA